MREHYEQRHTHTGGLDCMARVCTGCAVTRRNRIGDLYLSLGVVAYLRRGCTPGSRFNVTTIANAKDVLKTARITRLALGMTPVEAMEFAADLAMTPDYIIPAVLV